MVKGSMGRNMSATDTSGWYTAVAAKHASTAPLAPRLGLIVLSELRTRGEEADQAEHGRGGIVQRQQHNIQEKQCPAQVGKQLLSTIDCGRNLKADMQTSLGTACAHVVAPPSAHSWCARTATAVFNPPQLYDSCIQHTCPYASLPSSKNCSAAARSWPRGRLAPRQRRRRCTSPGTGCGPTRGEPRARSCTAPACWAACGRTGGSELRCSIATSWLLQHATHAAAQPKHLLHMDWRLCPAPVNLCGRHHCSCGPQRQVMTRGTRTHAPDGKGHTLP